MKNTFAGIGIALAILIAVPLLVMYAAGVGIFSAKVQAVVAKKTLNSKVTSQVFNANNKIQSQGYFEGLNADFRKYLVQIKIQKEAVASDPSSYNKTNLLGLRQECVNTVADYNAAAKSISSAPFRSANLPYQLNAARCAA